MGITRSRTVKRMMRLIIDAELHLLGLRLESTAELLLIET